MQRWGRAPRRTTPPPMIEIGERARLARKALGADRRVVTTLRICGAAPRRDADHDRHHHSAARDPVQLTLRHLADRRLGASCQLLRLRVCDPRSLPARRFEFMTSALLGVCGSGPLIATRSHWDQRNRGRDPDIARVFFDASLPLCPTPIPVAIGSSSNSRLERIAWGA